MLSCSTDETTREPKRDTYYSIEIRSIDCEVHVDEGGIIIYTTVYLAGEKLFI